MYHTGNLIFILGFYRQAVASSDLSLIFCLDRNTVAVVTHRNNVVLQVGSVGAVHHAVQLGVNLILHPFHAAADGF